MKQREIQTSAEEVRNRLEVEGKVLPEALARALARRLHPTEWQEVGDLYVRTGPAPERFRGLTQIDPTEDAEPIDADPDDLDFGEIQRIIFGWSEPLDLYTYCQLSLQVNVEKPSRAASVVSEVPDSPILDWVMVTEYGDVADRLPKNLDDLSLVIAEPEMSRVRERVEWLNDIVNRARNGLETSGWKIGKDGKLGRTTGGRHGTFLNQSIRELAKYLRPRFASRWPKEAGIRSPQRLHKHIHTLLSPIFGDVTLGGIRGILDKPDKL